MTEYDYGPWQDVPEGGLVQLEGFPDGYKGHPSPRYRILTPRPRREFHVGKWYKTTIGTRAWKRCIAVEGGMGWLVCADVAEAWPADEIDWSVPPRDEAPE